ncbi:MAG: hypothetical protein AAGK14_07280 [Verrucomicrobiota bacterium]
MTESEIAAWAERKSGGIVSARMRWTTAVRSMAAQAWPKNRLTAFIEAVEDPDHLTALLHLWSRQFEENPETSADALQEWWDRMEDTGVPLSQWLEAVYFVHEHAEKAGQQPSLATVVGFVACCEEAAGMGYGYGSLPDVTLQMLAQHGFEG